MSRRNLTVALSFEGFDADEHEIDFYDVARALIGFERSLAITTHLVLNGEVITQAPSLQGARISALPPEEGSWKILASISILATSTYALTTAPKDTVLGHLVTSAYDYIVSETLGFHVDYDKSLGELYEEHQKKNGKLPVVRQSQLDSALEKCENSIREMHRPIAYSKTAAQAKIIAAVHGKKIPFSHPLDTQTFDYMNFTRTSDVIEEMEGYVTSYNANTYKGRMFFPRIGRPISFELADTARKRKYVSKITTSLHRNAQERMREGSGLLCAGYRKESRTGILKQFNIVEIKDLE